MTHPGPEFVEGQYVWFTDDDGVERRGTVHRMIFATAGTWRYDIAPHGRGTIARRDERDLREATLEGSTCCYAGAPDEV